MYKMEGKRTVSYAMSEEGRSFDHGFVYDEGEPWSVLLNDFITFLEASGFEGVRKRVSIEESPFVDDRWQGPTHSGDDWK